MREITIVTGERNCGKTSYVKRLAENMAHVGGILSEKTFTKAHIELPSEQCFEPLFDGYHIKDLRTGQEKPFLKWKPGASEEAKGAGQWIGPFEVNPEGLTFAYSAIELALAEGRIVVIDEIGQAELKGGLFHDSLKRVLLSNSDLYLVVQAQVVEDIKKLFPQLMTARILEVGYEDTRKQ